LIVRVLWAAAGAVAAVTGAVAAAAGAVAAAGSGVGAAAVPPQLARTRQVNAVRADVKMRRIVISISITYRQGHAIRAVNFDFG
jgi:hypothetical protein